MNMYRTHTCLNGTQFAPCAQCHPHSMFMWYVSHIHLFMCACVYVCGVYVRVSCSYTYTCNTCSLFPSSERKAGVYKCIRSCVHMLTHTHLFICSCVYVCSVYIRVSICSHIHTCLYTHVLGWVCIAHTHTCLYNHVFMRVSIITPTLVPRSKVHPFSCAHMFP